MQRRVGVTRIGSTAVAAAAGAVPRTTRRHIDQYHQYLNDPEVKQTASVDPVYRVKGDQQDWNNTQQFMGYSDTYVKRFMRYHPVVEQFTGVPEHEMGELKDLLGAVYNEYGAAADILEKLEADPLNTAFAEQLAQAQEHASLFEEFIDKTYPKLHPTYKTICDAFLVRRHYALGDWIELVQRKRKQTLERLSPEFVAKAREMRGVGEEYIARLEQLGQIFDADPAFYLEGSGLTETEKDVVRTRVTYYRKMRSYGRRQAIMDDGML